MKFKDLPVGAVFITRGKHRYIKRAAKVYALHNDPAYVFAIDPDTEVVAV